jgi:hypothetical protein
MKKSLRFDFFNSLWEEREHIPSPLRGRLGWGLLLEPAAQNQAANYEYRTRNFETPIITSP